MRSALAATPIALLTAALLLSGCTATAPTPGPDNDPVPTPEALALEPGACLADYNGVDSDRTSLVACTAEHAFDVFEIATWPEMDAELAATDAGDLYDEIMAEEATPRSNEYWAWADEHCYGEFLSYIGLSSAVIEGKTAEELAITPGGRWNLDYSLASRDAFVEGDTSTVCSLTWFDETGADITVAHADGVTAADLLGTFTPELQTCYTRNPEVTDNLRYVDKDCTTPHNGQYLLYLDGLAALGAEYMATMDPTTTLFADYGPLDGYCATAIEEVFPGLLDDDTWQPWADQVAGWLGWENYDGTIDPTLLYPVYCGVLTTTDGTTVVGDAISGDIIVSLEIG
jgi:hypothetical protein